MKLHYEQLVDNKYKYKGEVNFNNYQEGDDTKNLTNSESLQVFKKKLSGNNK